MDQNALLITAIVGVVLGGIGLIGGVLGYVQSTAAVRRSTHARQRAVAAEEEALRAKAAAEATLRAAEELAERFRGSSPRLQTGPVGTGRYPGVPPTRWDERPLTGPTVTPMAEPTTGATLLPDTGSTPQQVPVEMRPVQWAAPPVSAPVPVQEVRVEQAGPRSEPSPAAPPAELPAAVEPEPVPDFVPVPDASVPDQAQPVDPIDGPATQESGSDGSEDAEPEFDDEVDAEPVAEEPDPDEPDAGETEVSEESATAPGADATAVVQAAQIEGVDRSAAADSTPERSEAPPEPDVTEPEAPAEPQDGRDATGRVTAGVQDAPTMDWAEVLRTGAIPLPSISRGTYAAPRRRPKPTGQGPARFELRTIGRQRYEAVNVGAEPALEARIVGGGDDPHLVRPLSSRPATVAPGGTLAFSVLRVEGREVSVQVTHVLDGDTVHQDLPVA